MRNDMGLQRDVTHELKWNPVTKDSEIAVAVKDGVVTLGETLADDGQLHRPRDADDRRRGDPGLRRRGERAGDVGRVRRAAATGAVEEEPQPVLERVHGHDVPQRSQAVRVTPTMDQG